MWLLALIGVVLAEYTVPDCPQPEDISPCSCEQFYGLTILCEDFESVDQIYRLAKQLQGLKIRNLYFINHNISESIKSDAFMGIYVTEVELFRSAINLEAPLLEGLEDSLRRLSFSKCFDSKNSLGTLDLGHLLKLEKLFIVYNEIDNLPDGWLASAPDSLDSIYLDRNGLKSLGDHAFSDLTSLRFILLNENKLSSMKRSMFPKPANNLRGFDIKGNQLDHLPSDMFTEMPVLKWVDMRNNCLTILDMRTWSVVLPQLNELDLKDNPLHCDSSMEWLPTSPAWDQGTSVLGRCDFPLNMKGKSLKQLKAEDFE